MKKNIFYFLYAICMVLAYLYASGGLGVYNPALMEWWIAAGLSCFLLFLYHYGRDL